MTQSRWNLVWIALGIALAAWLVTHVNVAVTWDDVMDFLKVRNRERYTRLFVLGVTITCLCAVYRVLKGKNE